MCLMNDFPEKVEISPDIKNDFLSLFLSDSCYKWCAALSSVVLHGEPEGHKIRFNANVWWEKVLGLDVKFMFEIFENWSPQHFPEYLTLRIHVFKLKFAFKIFVKLCVFLCLMSDFPEKVEISPDIKNDFLSLFLTKWTMRKNKRTPTQWRRHVTAPSLR